MSIIALNILAGDILSILEQQGGRARLDQIRPSFCCTREAVLMALGRLLSDGLVTVDSGIGDWIVKLGAGGLMAVHA